MVSKGEKYYERASPGKIVKAQIASTYLIPWANVVGRYSQQLNYVDLFSGKGRFDDGTPSTPLLIMDAIQENPWLKDRLRMTFVEEISQSIEELDKNLRNHVAYLDLKYKPKLINRTIDLDYVTKLSESLLPATYSFIDPWGYKEISLDIINSVSSAWGSDCLVYVTVYGIKRNVKNVEKQAKLRKFFGEDNLCELIGKIRSDNRATKLAELVSSSIDKALRSKGREYFLRFCIEFDKTRTGSHFLIFMSKNKLGFKIMRDIMIARCEKDSDDLPTFEFSPVTQRTGYQLNLSGTVPDSLLDQLVHRIKGDFTGKKIQVSELLKECLTLGYPYANSHINKALKRVFGRSEKGPFTVIRDGQTQEVARILNKDIVEFK